MPDHLVFLSIPGLRGGDLQDMPRLQSLAAQGSQRSLLIDFPAVTWPAQASALTGKTPAEHGVVANGFFWRDEARLEMWTAWNSTIQSPQIWDLLKQAKPGLTSAVWFPMLSKGSHAEYVCMPAPVHNPDGSESLWCYSKPESFYGELLERLGHFPLQHFWGPLANVKSSDWIVDSALIAFARFHPNFFYIYLPHLDYAAQKFGPNSPQARQSLGELDCAIGRLIDGVHAERDVVWMAASEYVIADVRDVAFPNRALREAGLLRLTDGEERVIDYERSDAWTLVDHQLGHVFVRDRDRATIERARETLTRLPHVEHVLVGDQRRAWGLEHQRAGDLILVSSPGSWQAYYWWSDPVEAPSFARQVDIHRKPGFDPVELFWDPESQGVPLRPEAVRGSHGLATDASDGGVILCSEPWADSGPLRSRDICNDVLRRFL